MTSSSSSIYERFHLKTDDANDGAKGAGEEQASPAPKGRLYATKYAQQPGGLRVEEMICGLQMAHLSCTDDSDEGRFRTTMMKEPRKEVIIRRSLLPSIVP